MFVALICGIIQMKYQDEKEMLEKENQLLNERNELLSISYEDAAYDREKYRIRVYNFRERSIKLERKRKFENYINYSDEETEKIIQGDYAFLLHSPHALCREFYFECMTNVK